MTKSNLLLQAAELPTAWRSVIVGRAADANFKVLRMDDRAYPNETHDFDEALLERIERESEPMTRGRTPDERRAWRDRAVSALRTLKLELAKH